MEHQNWRNPHRNAPHVLSPGKAADSMTRPMPPALTHNHPPADPVTMSRDFLARQSPSQQSQARQIYDRLCAGDEIEDVKGLITNLGKSVDRQKAEDARRDNARRPNTTETPRRWIR